MYVHQPELSLSPLSFCLQTTVGCKYTCLDHLSAFLKTFLDPAGLQCLHTCMHLWPHEAHTDVYILYIILGLIFKLLLTTAVHIWFPTSFYFSTQTANIPWHLNILIYIYMHHDHSNTLTKAQSFKWKKKKVLSLRTPVVHRKSHYDPLCRVRVSIHIFIYYNTYSWAYKNCNTLLYTSLICQPDIRGHEAPHHHHCCTLVTAQ